MATGFGRLGLAITLFFFFVVTGLRGARVPHTPARPNLPQGGSGVEPRARGRLLGRGPFGEEFVTAGGVDLGEVNLATMESRRCAGLYLAGELLDVDGVTGGFNFQACWSGGWLAGQSIALAD